MLEITESAVADTDAHVLARIWQLADAGLAIALLLIWIGLYVIEQLAAESKLEDCVMQGRLDCLKVELTPLR